jgi:hypothetical protein
VPAGRVRGIDEVYAWDQTASQGLVIDVEHTTALDQHGPALRAEFGLARPVGPGVAG